MEVLRFLSKGEKLIVGAVFLNLTLKNGYQPHIFNVEGKVKTNGNQPRLLNCEGEVKTNLHSCTYLWQWQREELTEKWTLAGYFELSHFFAGVISRLFKTFVNSVKDSFLDPFGMI